MSVGLLDVNILIALAWPSHVHHGAAHAWFAEQSNSGWATCPLTQCAFVRISSNPKVIPEAVTPGEALALLRDMVALEHHVFWPDDLPLADESVPTGLVLGHQQITDAYLLGLALHHGGKLVTLDRSLAALAPAGAAASNGLEIVPVGGV